MKKTANAWEYKVGINAIIANFVCMWKSRIRGSVARSSRSSQIQHYYILMAFNFHE